MCEFLRVSNAKAYQGSYPRYQYYRIILSQAELEEPPLQPTQRGKSKQSVGRNLLNRLKKYENEVLVFAYKGPIYKQPRDWTYDLARLNKAATYLLV